MQIIPGRQMPRLSGECQGYLVQGKAMLYGKQSEELRGLSINKFE
jgi:hypothetical protein